MFQPGVKRSVTPGKSDSLIFSPPSPFMEILCCESSRLLIKLLIIRPSSLLQRCLAFVLLVVTQVSSLSKQSPL